MYRCEVIHSVTPPCMYAGYTHGLCSGTNLYVSGDPLTIYGLMADTLSLHVSGMLLPIYGLLLHF